MIDFGNFLNWLKHRRLIKNRLTAQRMLLNLNALTVTVHGRQMLAEVCKDPDNGLPNEIRHMYWTLIKEAPIKVWAQRN